MLLSRHLALPSTLLALAAAVIMPEAASAQPKAARGSMEQCVDRVITGMLGRKATDLEVGRAVVSQCDAQLKATLAEAIKNGEASSCTVEKCIQVARDEATREAREVYRARSQGARQ